MTEHYTTLCVEEGGRSGVSTKTVDAVNLKYMQNKFCVFLSDW